LHTRCIRPRFARSSSDQQDASAALRVRATVWQFILGLIVGVSLGIVIMAALVASGRKP